MSEYGYPKQERLLKRGDYLSLSKSGEKCHRKHFLCIYRTGEAQTSRLGITVSRKVGPAVVRNRIKRTCREFFRLNKNMLGGVWDINLIAKKRAGDATREAVVTSLKEIFRIIAEKRTSDR
jgi:ribonuclease P protein component